MRRETVANGHKITAQRLVELNPTSDATIWNALGLDWYSEQENNQKYTESDDKPSFVQ